MIRLFTLLWICCSFAAAQVRVPGPGGNTSSVPSVTAATCSQADVQTAINAASDGWIVKVPTGSCTWASAISSSKAITIQCGIGGTTNLTGQIFVMTTKGTAATRITACNFNSANALEMDGVATDQTYRLDNNVFTNASQVVFVNLGGNGPGLLDHNTFTGGGASEDIHNNGMGAASSAGWIDDVVPGSANMVFVEDNTFNCSDPNFFCTGINGFYGARTVVRHNLFNFTQIDMHGTAGAIGARWYELYENTFDANTKTQSNYMAIRAASGVIFNNHVIGSNGGSGALEVTEEDTTTPECTALNTPPCLWQIGRGIYAASPSNPGRSSPTYIWGNDVAMTIVDSAATIVRLNTDYFTSSSQPGTLNRCQSAADVVAGCPVSYSYTPFTYPHPLNH